MPRDSPETGKESQILQGKKEEGPTEVDGRGIHCLIDGRAEGRRTRRTSAGEEVSTPREPSQGARLLRCEATRTQRASESLERTTCRERQEEEANHESRSKQETSRPAENDEQDRPLI